MMWPRFDSWLGRLRWVSLAEGVSYLLLLGVAMPLKYGADWPLGVEVLGWVHGLLFVALGGLVLVAWRRVPLGVGLCFGVMLAALLPFGPFVADRWLVVEEKAHG